MTLRLAIPLPLLLAACATPATYDLAAAPPSEIKSEASITPRPFDWGEAVTYFTDATPVVDDTNVAVVRLVPGRNPHPPHKHVEEEYIYVLEGRGEWYLNGETVPATKGDTLYARSWDYHGITAAEDSPLDFIIFKYTGAQIENAPDPDPSMPEEILE